MERFILLGKGKLRKKNGFTLVEVICALAILVIAVLPIYQATLNASRLTQKAEMQLLANSLAQSEMEHLKNRNDLAPGKIAYTDNVYGTFYIESNVEAISPVEMPVPPVQGSSWHFRLVFRNTNVFLLGNFSEVTIYDRNGVNRGVVYAKTYGLHTGLKCELNFTNFIDFIGLSTVRISSSVLQGLGIDLSKPGTAQGSVNIRCEGSLNESLDFYLGGGTVLPYLMRYKVDVRNSIDLLNIKYWPGAKSYMSLTTGPASGSTVKLVDQGYILSVKVYESQEHYQSGEAELAALKSLRHTIRQAGEAS